MQILTDPQTNILSELDINEWKDARKIIIDSIMATDMAKHKPILEDFENKITEYQNATTLSRDQQTKIAAVFTHICDLSGASKTYDIAFQWSNLVRKEFMKQVEDEKLNGLPITPFMVGLENELKFIKGELFFQKCIVLHLFEVGNKYLTGELDFVIEILDKNYSQTEKYAKELEAAENQTQPQKLS